MIQLADGPLAAEEARRVGTERKIHAHRAERRAVAQAESEALNGVVEILQILLVKAQVDLVYGGIDIAHIVEDHAA